MLPKCPIKDKDLFAETYPDTITLDNFDDAIIGITDDDKLVYSWEQMIELLVEVDGMSPFEAREYIEFNAIRALPYMGEKAPVIMYEIEC